jgi:tetratricopeptide (TPR) repeat protein
MDISYLWDSWLVKFSWLSVFAMSGVMIYMLSTHVVETKAHGVIHSPQARLELKYKPRRSPKIDNAIKQCVLLFSENKADELIALAKEIITADPKESFAYMYLAHGYSLKDNYPGSLANYRQAVEMNPDFVDKTSPDRIGKKYLMPLVRKAVVLSRTSEFKKTDNYKATLKNLYYLQRRMAGGCE